MMNESECDTNDDFDFSDQSFVDVETVDDSLEGNGVKGKQASLVLSVNVKRNPLQLSTPNTRPCFGSLQVDFTPPLTPPRSRYAMVRERTTTETMPPNFTNTEYSVYQGVENLTPTYVVDSSFDDSRDTPVSAFDFSRHQFSRALFSARPLTPVRTYNQADVDMTLPTLSLLCKKDNSEIRARKRFFYSSWRRMCGIDGCKNQCSTVKNLCDHLQTFHNISTYITTILFSKADDFRSFLKELSDDEITFRRDRKKGIFGTYKCRQLLFGNAPRLRIVNPTRGNVSSYYDMDYDCCEYGTPSKGPFIREGGECPAFLSAKADGNRIKVLVCDWHLHGPIIPRLALQKIEDLYVNKKMPVSAIARIIRGTAGEFCTKGSDVDVHIRSLKDRHIQFLCHYVVNNVHDTESTNPHINLGSNILTDFERRCLEQQWTPVPLGPIISEPLPIDVRQNDYIVNEETIPHG
ncbi:hypothetical protein RB195_016275 [Necator americanus]|uniref:C2H2-type domain-containing protein n=1 Tax=Necator americanus TaxID=51031 RepID=A0ABR1E8D5_NECAM